MKYLPRLAALDTMESSFLGFCHHVEKTNDQSDLRVGRADRGSRIHNSGHGCPRQRCRGTARRDQDPYRRGLCAGSERRRVCLGSLYCTSLHAQHHQLIRTKSRAGRPRQPDHAHSPAQNCRERAPVHSPSAFGAGLFVGKWRRRDCIDWHLHLGRLGWCRPIGRRLWRRWGAVLARDSAHRPVRMNVPLGENVAAFQQAWRPLNTGSVGRLLAPLRHANGP